MARKSKTDKAQITEAPDKELKEEVKVDLTPQNETSEIPQKEAKEGELPNNVTELMRLYPQYEKLWISNRGFVYPEATPKYMRGDATLYKNIFFNNKN